MKKTLQLIAMGCIALISTLSFASSSSSMDWISIEGNSFVNEAGETVIFKGVNIRDPHNLEEDGHWTMAHFQEAQNWGANVIRLPIHPISWRARGEKAYLQLLDEAVSWANELGLYLILDWHSIGNLKEEKYQHEMYVTDMAETEAFWSSVSARYAKEAAVFMYELFNEPTVSGKQFGDCSWEDWKAINESLIKTVRANHPKSIIGVAGFNWAYDLTPIKAYPIDAEGIAYISHPYPMKREAPWEDKWQADFGYVA
ncbi:MAG: cellulase family glycosylhydrolase, partial [Bacteroides sp.]|nr:cellulase family glycosylhydrolase [Bacteroides sp.]